MSNVLFQIFKELLPPIFKSRNFSIFISRTHIPSRPLCFSEHSAICLNNLQGIAHKSILHRGEIMSTDLFPPKEKECKPQAKQAGKRKTIEKKHDKGDNVKHI